jgi:hypothetical protein
MTIITIRDVPDEVRDRFRENLDGRSMSAFLNKVVEFFADAPPQTVASFMNRHVTLTTKGGGEAEIRCGALVVQPQVRSKGMTPEQIGEVYRAFDYFGPDLYEVAFQRFLGDLKRREIVESVRVVNPGIDP